MATPREKSFISQAAELAESVLPTIESAVTAAKEVAIPLLNDAREAAAPLLADGKALAAEKAAATKGLAAATAAKAAAAMEDVEPDEARKGRFGWLKKLLLIGGLAAVGAVVFRKLRSDSTSDNWQSSYVPTPAPVAAEEQEVEPEPELTEELTDQAEADEPEAHATEEPEQTEADDASGASPDEAASDALEEPHPVSTPDEPAEVVEIQTDKKA
jgi:hypothetical protein